MSNIKKLVEKFFKEKFNGWDENDNLYADYVTAKDLIEFARQMCELQKEKCSIVGRNFGNSTRDFVEEEILNCKNVCDE